MSSYALIGVDKLRAQNLLLRAQVAQLKTDVANLLNQFLERDLNQEQSLLEQDILLSYPRGSTLDWATLEVKVSDDQTSSPSGEEGRACSGDSTASGSGSQG